MNLASYLIQVNIYLILFYIFYATILKRETFFVLNRVYLVGTSIVSLLIPLLKLEWFEALSATQTVEKTAQTIIIKAEPIILTPTAQSGLTYSNYLTFIYLAGVTFFAIRFLVSLISVISGRSAESHAWSFFNKIVVTENIPSRETILLHEKVHARQVHSADCLFAECIAILCWFNPVVYRLKKAIKHIHEFIADEVSAKGNKAEYATLLVSEAIGIKPHQLVNSFFNESLLKQRIIMLSKTKSKKVAILKYGLSAPLFVGMLIVSSVSLKAKENKILKKANSVAVAIVSKPTEVFGAISTPENSLKTTVPRNEASGELFENATETPKIKEMIVAAETDTPVDTGIYDQANIDTQPDFPGGINKFREYIGQNYRYPKAASDAGVAGRIIVQFVVEKDGSLNKVRVIKDLGYGTGEEAARVIKMSPKWNPAIKNGEPIRVMYTLPFALTAPSVTFGGLKDDKNFNATKSTLEINGPDSKTTYILLDGKKITMEELKKLDSKSIESIEVIKNRAKFSEFGAPEDASSVIKVKTKH